MPTKMKVAPVPPQPPAHYRVRVRMYRQGLGDCFLLSFPQEDGSISHLLIDCGVVLGTGEPGAVMTRVARDVSETTKQKLDVLVITHEHWDHLSGFDQAQARAVFDDIEIGKLWLAWTEDETDDLANRLRADREKKKAAARAAMEEARKRGHGRREQRLASLLDSFGVSAAAGSGSEDEDLGGTAGALKFLKEKCTPTIIETGKSYGLPGAANVRVYAVGPPKDGKDLASTNPLSGEGYGFGNEHVGLAEAFLAGFDPANETGQPFAGSLRRSLQKLKAAARRRHGEVPPGLAGYYRTTSEWRNIDEAWIATGERLALQLDNATNNTSLVLAFEFDDGDVLLFVGDAQAGNWRSWESLTWKITTPAGEKRKVTSADLLKRTIFYKVGHHGSHNATMRDKGLELMKSDRLAAFIPVDTKVAHEVKGWEHMPLPAIRARLKEKCAVVFQSDMDTEEKRKIPGACWIESVEKFPVRMKDPKTKKMITVKKRPLYIDFFV